MGVVKLTSSGKALQFITDDGVVYQCARGALGFLSNSQDVVRLSRLAWGVSPDRFPVSEVYGSAYDSAMAREKQGEKSLSKDSFSYGASKDRKSVKSYSGVKVVSFD